MVKDCKIETNKFKVFVLLDSIEISSITYHFT